MTPRRPSLLTGPLAALALVPLASAQTVWRVDDNGGADFVHIQDAVDAAQDGDVIEVEPGAYAAFAIDGKALTVRGLGAVDVAASVVVRNVPVGTQTELDALRIGTSYTALVPALRVEQNPGTVRVVDSTITGRCAAVECTADGSDGNLPALSCEGTAALVILRCTLVGGNGYYAYEGLDDGGDGSPAVDVAATSWISVHESLLTGGDGGDADGSSSNSPGRGAVALELRDSSGFADLGTFDGGSGGTSLYEEGYDAVGYRTSNSTFVWKLSAFLQGSTPYTPSGEVFVAPYCFGTFEECPCHNAGRGTAGCESSFDTGGVLLTATGEASVSADTVVLTATGLNPNAAPTGLFFQGTEREDGGLGTPFNDGLLCAGGTVRRLKGKPAANGALALGFGVAGDPPVSSLGGLPAAGGTRTYQVWYRNQSPSFCTPARFNTSNGVEIAWGP